MFQLDSKKKNLFSSCSYFINTVWSYKIQWNSYKFTNETAIYLAVEKRKIEIIKLLLMNDKLDINIRYIIKYNFIKFIINLFNHVQYYCIQ